MVEPAETGAVARMRNHPLVDEFYQPDQVGLPKENDNVHERNNRWALYSALGRGIDRVRLIAVWDGKNEYLRDLDARLVKHMVDLMRDTGGMVEQIHPGKLARIVSPDLSAEASPIPVAASVPTAAANSKKKSTATNKKK